MVRNRDLRKYISSVVLIMFMLSLMMVQAPVSLAKTLQTPIADPSNDTVALNVIIGGETLPYTWGDIIGAAGYKFAGKATSDTYLAEEETCDGIKFSDLLANVESTLGITLQDTYNIQAVCSDAYSNQPFTVAEAKDYETNHYLLAYKVNGVSEACIGYKDSDPSVTYPATYLRIARNRGGDFSTDGFGRSAYMRLISSINITKSDGSAVELAPQGTVGEKEPGGDVSNSVFYIAVKDASGETKYYYYTKAELETYETQSAYTYNDHGVIKTVTCKGALLKDLLADLQGVSITDDMIVQYAEEDAYHADAKTDVIDSNYKDTIESLTKPTLDGSGNTKNPMRPIVTYLIHEEYESPDEFNVNDPEGVFKDADKHSGYLRAYRDTGGANSAVIKYLMGVVVSTDGALLSGKNGCLVTSVSDKNPSIKVRDDITIKGLLPGMQYAVKAPAATNANLATGQTSPVLITVGSGVPADQTITFQYTEDTYFYVNNALTGKITNYTYTDLIAEHEQVPDANANTAPYGYSRPMYYRYNGVWLSDLVSGISGNYSIKLVAKDGTKTDITDNIALYFIAYNNTRSKTSTNIPEGKRVTDTYNDAKIIIPSTGENITGSAADDYTTAGKDVDVLVAAAEGLEITVKSQGAVDSKEPGGDISNSVFYIAVKDTASSETKYYYYTKAELETYETQSAYTYNDHGVIKTVTCKGALLKDLLANLKGVSIKDDMIVQYAEEDAYHADAKTDVIDSNYKDTIESLTKPTLDGSGNTKNPMRPIVTYAIHEEYADPDAYNVNDPAGEFKDPDPDSFAYTKLRAYRDTGGANSAVIKYLMGVVVSTDGALLSGKNGCLVTSVSDKNPSIKVRDDITIKGLIPGMQYAVKAPAVTNASLAAAQTNPVLITVGSGAPAEQVITFKYTEDTYFYVKNALTDTTTDYTYTDLIAMHIQVPDASANTPPYGYSRPMYYRYNGVWLSDLVSGISGNYSIKLVAKDGTKTDITDNIALYFIAYNNTRSKTSTNIPEGKRVTDTYNDAKIIIPSTGENITGSAADDYTTAGKDVDVLMAAAEGLEITEGAPVLPGFELWPMQTASKLDKTWTIKFNQAVDKDTVVADNIYVTDNYNVKTVETTLIISKDLKSVQVTPKADYTPNQEYRLYISNELQAKDSQKNLNKSLVMPFKINNN